jgi:hypothetical protein
MNCEKERELLPSPYEIIIADSAFSETLQPDEGGRGAFNAALLAASINKRSRNPFVQATARLKFVRVTHLERQDTPRDKKG